MKRSEAIQIISNYIYELNVEPEECDAESDKILKALENAGMLPPERKVAMGYTEHNSLKRYNADPIDFFYQWEQE